MTPRGPELDTEMRQAAAPTVESLDERLATTTALTLSLVNAVVALQRRLAKLEQRDEYR